MDQWVAISMGTANRATTGRHCRKVIGHTSHSRPVILSYSPAATYGPTARYSGRQTAWVSQGTVTDEARSSVVNGTPPTTVPWSR